MRRLQLTIESDLANVDLMAMAVNRICGYLEMDEIAAYQVELCVAEAATNAIIHAYSGQSRGDVCLVLSIHHDRIELDFCDTGVPMLGKLVSDLKSKSHVEARDPTESCNLKEGGRGLQIMRDVMDEMSYVTEGGVNRLRLTKRLLPK